MGGIIEKKKKKKKRGREGIESVCLRLLTQLKERLPVGHFPFLFPFPFPIPLVLGGSGTERLGGEQETGKSKERGGNTGE